MSVRTNVKDKKDRPLPPLTRKPEHVKDINVYALLIGINDYQGDINPLGGCVKDVRLIHQYLKARFPQDKLHVKTLLDDKATREHIIEAFTEHLIKGGGRGIDTFWFHFSGHGSEQFTAEEFMHPKDAEGNPLPSLEPNGKDQTLVCYNPEGTQDGIFLADKELAVLIQQLFEQIPAIDELKPHIIVSLDCCHSGTGTRDLLEPDGMRTRQFNFIPPGVHRDAGIEMGLDRKIEDYFGEYKSMLDTGRLAIPQAPHLLISACAKNEKAGDFGTGGAFTASFIDLLDDLLDPKQMINYANLFQQTRTKVLQIRDDQTPQFEPVAGFNPYTAFLEGWGLGDSNQFQVFRQGGDWFIRNGAIHGLPVRSEEQIKLQVWGQNPVEYLGLATVTKVNMQDSKVQFDDFIIADDAVDRGYFAELFALPAAPEHVIIEGDQEAAISALTDSWDIQINDEITDPVLSHLNVFHLSEPQTGISPVAAILVNEEGGYLIKDPESDRILDLIQPNDDFPLNLALLTVKRAIDKMVRWKRLLHLQNPASKLTDAFNFELLTMDYSGWKAAGRPSLFEGQATFISEMQVHTSNSVQLFGSTDTLFTPENADELDVSTQKDALVYGLRLHSFQPDLFYYLYHFRQNRAINLLHDSQLKQATGAEGVLFGSLGLMNLLDTENEDTFHLKLLVTRRAIDKESLLQSGFPIDRGLTSLTRASDANDWYFQNLTVKFVRQHQPFTSEEASELSNGDLRIVPHSRISAQPSLISGRQGSDEVAAQLSAFAKIEDLEQISFTGNEDNLGTQQVLVLKNIQKTADLDLEQQPLVISLGSTLASEEDLVVPIAFDGQFFRVIGDAAMGANSRMEVRLRQLPELTDGAAVSGLEIAFFKMPLRKNRSLGLRWVRVHKDEGIKRHVKRRMITRVNEADHILLLLPDLYGNSADLALQVPHIKDANGLRLHRKYDLILTYDYQAFRGSIRAMARRLKRQLENAGLGLEGEKTLTIIGHGIGGLIARWLIEMEGGGDLVDKLVMVGTPNNGLNIVDWKDKLNKTLDLIANFQAAQLPAALQARQDYLDNLDDLKVPNDLKPDSRLLKQLNEAPAPDVSYAIVGANARRFELEGADFQAFLKRFDLEMGGVPNDGMARLESINGLGLWSAKTVSVDVQEVIGHHFNYFTANAGRIAIGSNEQ